MRKKTIALFLIAGIVVSIIGGIVYGIGAASSVTVATNGTAQVAASGISGLVIVGGVILAIGGILSFISWIGALVATGKQGRWGWFVCIFLFSWIAEIIYLIAGPGLPSATAAPLAQNVG